MFVSPHGTSLLLPATVPASRRCGGFGELVDIGNEGACADDGNTAAQAENRVEHGISPLNGHELTQQRLREIPAAPPAGITFEKISEHECPVLEGTLSEALARGKTGAS
jgi:hypothetical protein